MSVAQDREQPRTHARTPAIEHWAALGELEQRLSDAVFKSVPERIAGALVTLAAARSGRPLGRGVQIKLTHEQLAALAATSRETTTKTLGESADRGLITLGRARITILDRVELGRLSGD